jgi:hypothetical protein
MKHILLLILLVFLLVTPACAKKEQVNTPQETLSQEDNSTAQAIAQQTAELSHEDTEENADDVIASQPTDSTCDGLDFYGQCAKLKGTITFGSYPQETDTPEPIEWRVLDINDEGQILILSKKVLDVKPYNTTYIDITWEKSTIRSWLNGYEASYNKVGNDYTSDNFIDTAFGAEEKANIVASYVPAHSNPNYSTATGNATTDKVFMLSSVEAENYFANNEARQAEATPYASNTVCTSEHCYSEWWLRSPGSTSDKAEYVLKSGIIDNRGGDINDVSKLNGVRPALWIQY